MEIGHNDIVLRPKFELVLGISKEKALNTFDDTTSLPFALKCSGNHIFITFNREYNHFWSPQLHLEFNEEGHNSCKLFGQFGPNPALWTFFIFLHFGVTTLFIILAIRAYTGVVLDLPNMAHLAGMVFFNNSVVCSVCFRKGRETKGETSNNTIASVYDGAGRNNICYFC